MNSAIRFVNLTGRKLTVFTSKEDQTGVQLEAEGKAEYKGFTARGTTVLVNGLPVACAAQAAPETPKASDIVGLPDTEPGTVFIVPFPVAAPAYVLGRRDIMSMGAARINNGVQTGAEGFNYPGTEAELRQVLEGNAAQQ